MRLFIWLLTMLLWAGTGLAAAAEVAPDLRALIEHLQAHRRVALGYLQAGNSDLGAIEMERLRNDVVADRGKLKSLASDDPGLAQALGQTGIAVGASLKALDAGEMDRAAALLQRVAVPLDDWRRARGIRLFSDCIAELGTAYRRLDMYRATPPNLNDANSRDEIVADAASTATATAHCDREAPPSVHGEAEFRRLIDGMTASLRQLPDAVRQHDGDLLHRLLDEERAFDRLLAFRFG